MTPELIDQFTLLAFALVGLCVGSFLNVVIYRLPRGLNVSKPARSYCPKCESSIPWQKNIPVISWLWLRGKCASCGSRIPVRYLLVEVVTGAFFVACVMVFSPIAAGFAALLMALLVAIIWIDAELMVIPAPLTNIGLLGGLAAAAVTPELIDLGSRVSAGWWERCLFSAIGAATGFAALKAVIWLGKLVFGRQHVSYDAAVQWELREPASDDENLAFVIDGERTDWGEIFYRPTDRMFLPDADLIVDGRNIGRGDIEIRAEKISLGERSWDITEIESAGGTATSVTIPREAMGDGDPHLLAMIGAFLGAQSLLLVIMVSCVTAIGAAIAGRVGFGKALPYGPFLAVGAMVWLFGGWKLWELYLSSFVF